jgi:hypothetical protein
MARNGWCIVIGMLAASLVGGLVSTLTLSAARGQDAASRAEPMPADVVYAREMRVTDGEGNTRILLSANGGEPAIALCGADGKTGMFLFAGDNRADIALGDPNGAQIILSSGEQGGLTLYSGAELKAALTMSQGRASLAFYRFHDGRLQICRTPKSDESD